MKRFAQLVDATRKRVHEIYPWDLAEILADPTRERPLLVDIREPYEFERAHLADSLNVPRGILESACEYNYEETVPELADAREREVILMCRSGNRTVLAADVMQQMGYRRVYSLKTGLRGWSDDDRPMVDGNEQPVDPDDAFEYFDTRLRPEQIRK
jgi:rhodanese-related sulfurtransferase